MAIDPESFFEAVWNIISDEAEIALTLGWDGDAPGMSGAHWIKEWTSAKGKTLYFFESSDLDDEGPFDSMEEAMGEDFEIETPNPELSSDVLSLERLKGIGLRLVGNGDTIVINGELYRRRKNILAPTEE